MVSWSHHKRSGLMSLRCPAHGNLVVRRVDTSWVMKCETCLRDAAEAIRQLWRSAG